MLKWGCDCISEDKWGCAYFGNIIGWVLNYRIDPKALCDLLCDKLTIIFLLVATFPIYNMQNSLKIIVII